MSKNNRSDTFVANLKDFRKPKIIAITGMLLALYLVVYSLNIQISPVIEFRFGYLVLCLAGFTGGPLMGLAVGLLGDIISMIILAGKSSLPFFFGFTLSYAVLGLGAGFIFFNSHLNTIRIGLASLLEFIVSITLNTLWLSILRGTSFKVELLIRLPKSSIMLFINAIILYVFMNSIAVALKKVIYST
ncbi:MAG TPA: folate family ECF transporter S component [Clostridiales bacterium]|nr:folate family ECF transporter S component [Clostridiales bacterium]